MNETGILSKTTWEGGGIPKEVHDVLRDAKALVSNKLSTDSPTQEVKDQEGLLVRLIESVNKFDSHWRIVH